MKAAAWSLDDERIRVVNCPMGSCGASPNAPCLKTLGSGRKVEKRDYHAARRDLAQRTRSDVVLQEFVRPR